MIRQRLDEALVARQLYSSRARPSNSFTLLIILALILKVAFV